MATISNAWSGNEAWLGSNIISSIDNHFSAEAQDIRERARNGGHVWSSAASQSYDGVHCVSADNYVANEWAVYSSNTLSAKVFRCTANTLYSVKPATFSDTAVFTAAVTFNGQLKATMPKTLVVESPEAADNITIGYFENATTISKVAAVVRGSSPSATIQLVHDPSRAAAGNNVFASGQAISSTTTGTQLTSFSDATIPAGSWLWLSVSAVTGTVDELAVVVFSKED